MTRLGRERSRARHVRTPSRADDARPPKVRDFPPHGRPRARKQQIAGVDVLVHDADGDRRRQAPQQLVHCAQHKARPVAAARHVLTERAGFVRGEELQQISVHFSVGGDAVARPAVEARLRRQHVLAGDVQQRRQEVACQMIREGRARLQDHASLRARVRGGVDGQNDARAGPQGRQARAIDEARLVEGRVAEAVEVLVEEAARASDGGGEECAPHAILPRELLRGGEAGECREPAHPHNIEALRACAGQLRTAAPCSPLQPLHAALVSRKFDASRLRRYGTTSGCKRRDLNVVIN